MVMNLNTFDMLIKRYIPTQLSADGMTSANPFLTSYT